MRTRGETTTHLEESTPKGEQEDQAMVIEGKLNWMSLDESEQWLE